MRAIDIDKAMPGMVLGKTIYANDGRPLLRDGTALTERYIQALKQMKFGFVYIIDTRAPEIQVSDVIHEQVRQEATALIRQSFGEPGSGAASKVGVHLPAVAQMTKQIVESILSNRDLSIQMVDLKNHDNYTFSHSVNVCVIGTVLGYRLGLDEGRLKDLALGLILHDIGKIMIPKEIIDKPGKLTEAEFDQMKEHCRAGYDALRGVTTLSAHAKIIVLQHHEKYDGTGYPKGLVGEDIHLNAQIAAIADVYDALTSDRVYRKRMMPHEALAYLLTAAGKHFSRELVTTFVANVAPYPPGTFLKLSTGEEAIVIDVDMKAAARPIVKILKEANGRASDLARLLDLKSERDITISKVLTEVA